MVEWKGDSFREKVDARGPGRVGILESRQKGGRDIEGDEEENAACGERGEERKLRETEEGRWKWQAARKKK